MRKDLLSGLGLLLMLNQLRWVPVVLLVVAAPGWGKTTMLR